MYTYLNKKEYPFIIDHFSIDYYLKVYSMIPTKILNI